MAGNFTKLREHMSLEDRWYWTQREHQRTHPGFVDGYDPFDPETGIDLMQVVADSFDPQCPEQPFGLRKGIAVFPKNT